MDPRLANASIDDEVLELHPEYTAVVIIASGLNPGPSSEASEAALIEAEAWATAHLNGREPHELPEVAVWREAYAGFKVKPRDGRSSVEALMRRVKSGLPRIDRLTDIYNAVSVMQVMPIGGEDLNGYEGSARLVVATGDETFDTIANGEPVEQLAEPGEIVWRDDRGVTCRRWNWRQCVRTRLNEATSEALFIIDGLGPYSRARAEATAAELIARLLADSPNASFEQRTLGA